MCTHLHHWELGEAKPVTRTARNDIFGRKWNSAQETQGYHSGAIPGRGSANVMRDWQAQQQLFLLEQFYFQFYSLCNVSDKLGEDCPLAQIIEGIAISSTLHNFPSHVRRVDDSNTKYALVTKMRRRDASPYLWHSSWPSCCKAIQYMHISRLRSAYIMLWSETLDKGQSWSSCGQITQLCFSSSYHCTISQKCSCVAS